MKRSSRSIADRWSSLPEGAMLALPVAMLHLTNASLQLKFRSAQSIIDGFAIAGGHQSVTTNDHTSSKLKLIRWAILTSSRFLPWNTSCLGHSIAAAHWLDHSDTPYEFHLGVERNRGGVVSGHAWISVGGYDVTPGNNAGAYEPIYSTNNVNEVADWL